jgi:hypothetical protein
VGCRFPLGNVERPSTKALGESPVLTGAGGPSRTGTILGFPPEGKRRGERSPSLDVIILWGTGFGPTTPAAPGGVQVPSDQTYATVPAPALRFESRPSSSSFWRRQAILVRLLD